MVYSNEVTLAVTCPWGTPTQAELDAFWAMGDVNRDGFINATDLDLITVAYGSMLGDPNWNPDADLNKDGIVDAKDSSICSSNQGWDICLYFGRRDTTLTLAVGTVEPNIPFTLISTLKALDNGELIPNAEIVFWKALETSPGIWDNWIEIGRVNTNAGGVASLTDTLPINTKAKYQSGFGGNTIFTGC